MAFLICMHTYSNQISKIGGILAFYFTYFNTTRLSDPRSIYIVNVFSQNRI